MSTPEGEWEEIAGDGLTEFDEDDPWLEEDDDDTDEDQPDYFSEWLEDWAEDDDEGDED